MLFEEIAGIKSRFQEKIALYGKRTTVMIAVKAILRKIFGIGWQKYYLMSHSLEDVCPPPERSDIEIRELTLSDYENELWKDFLTEEKRVLYEARFKDSHAHAYGAFFDGTLAYSTWILYEKVIFSETETLLQSSDCALLLDTYCHPRFRGCGIHNYMNQWRLCKIKLCGMKKAYVIVLSYNRPAVKTQLKCGMEVEKTFYSFRVYKKKIIKL